MKISIVTVCLNSASTLGDTIDSVTAQDYRQVEHIIKDGKSTDATESIARAKKWHGLRYVSQEDTGIYDAMNQGLSLATGEIVGFLNADDFFAERTVVSRIARLFEQSGSDIVYGDVDMVDPRETSRITRKWRSGRYKQGIFMKGWQPPHPAFYVRRRILLEVGGFDTQYSIAADYALMLNLVELKRCRTEYDPFVWVKMRDGGRSNRSMKNIMIGNLECRRAMISFGMDPPLAFPLNKLWRKVRQK